ncbi:thioredoxin domain-containing protein 17 [Clonorchis sinensis]|uniref:Thioredoxin domain-containing protein 17 n=1 Tax=Clonorchis sinensis TaxID=79923 RepID=G7YF60_CLOSI|nr:thioredoxin domain-containing protein 17 [Clonorchis sinensis]
MTRREFSGYSPHSLNGLHRRIDWSDGQTPGQAERARGLRTANVLRLWLVVCKLQMCQRERFADSVELVEKYTKDALNQQRRVFAFFIGTMDPTTGDSWCPDSRAGTLVLAATVSITGNVERKKEALEAKVCIQVASDENPVDLKYVKHIVIVFEEEKAQVYLDELVKVIPSFCMHCGPTWWKFVLLDMPLTIQGETLEVVERFAYLGSCLSSECSVGGRCTNLQGSDDVWAIPFINFGKFQSSTSIGLIWLESYWKRTVMRMMKIAWRLDGSDLKKLCSQLSERLTRLNEHWMSSRSARLIAARKAIPQLTTVMVHADPSNTGQSGARRMTERCTSRGQMNFELAYVRRQFAWLAKPGISTGTTKRNRYIDWFTGPRHSKFELVLMCVICGLATLEFANNQSSLYPGKVSVSGTGFPVYVSYILNTCAFYQETIVRNAIRCIASMPMGALLRPNLPPPENAGEIAVKSRLVGDGCKDPAQGQEIQEPTKAGVPIVVLAEQIRVRSIPQLEACAGSALAKNRRVFIYFFGKTDPQTGKSWCPDVRRAEPTVLKGLKVTNESDLFIWCEVGDRDEWIIPENPFKKHHVLRLKEIPTLVSLASLRGQSFADSTEFSAKIANHKHKFSIHLVFFSRTTLHLKTPLPRHHKNVLKLRDLAVNYKRRLYAQFMQKDTVVPMQCYHYIDDEAGVGKQHITHKVAENSSTAQDRFCLSWDSSDAYSPRAPVYRDRSAYAGEHLGCYKHQADTIGAKRPVAIKFPVGVEQQKAIGLDELNDLAWVCLFLWKSYQYNSTISITFGCKKRALAVQCYDRNPVAYYRRNGHFEVNISSGNYCLYDPAESMVGLHLVTSK